MIKQINAKKTILRVVAVLLLAAMMLTSALTVYAYFSSITTPSTPTTRLPVNNLFGRLNNGTGDWGTASNPYLIHDQQHLKNLYVLQNTKDSSIINDTTVFQVSNPNGTPCYVGGIEIPSIGSEDFPFVSTLRGASVAGTVTLPNGEKSDTSTLGNIVVTGYEGQIDIGLFGNIGNDATIESKENATGKVSDLLLYNISINTYAFGAEKDVHGNHYLCDTPHETNHIGVLAGHAKGCIIENVSVYYPTADASPAFNITENNSASYVSAGGIVGYYENIFTADSTPYSTESNYSEGGGGGNLPGIGTGTLYAGDLWNSLTDTSANSYDLTTASWKSGESPYTSSSKTYFMKGVFTFVHSGQTVSKDKIAKLWTAEDDSSILNIADSYADDLQEWKSYSYSYSRVTAVSEFAATTSSNNEYYMIVARHSNGKPYAFTRAGATGTEAKEVEFTDDRIIIPGDATQESMFDNYCGARMRSGTGTSSTNYLLYGFRGTLNADGTVQSSGSGSNYYLTMSVQSGNWLNFGTSAGRNSTSRIEFVQSSVDGKTDQFHVYAYYSQATASNSSNRNYYKYLHYFENDTSLANLNSSGNNVSGNPSDISENSFNATNHYPLSTTNQTSSTTYTTSNGMSTSASHCYNYNSPRVPAENSGFTNLFEIYKVDRSSEQVITDKTVYYAQPTDENKKQYDMHENVLFYNKIESVANNGYYYDVTSLESLSWLDGNDQPITYVDTALSMADNISYSTAYNYGLTDANVGGTTLKVPMGSVAFQVQGTGVPDDKVNINLIVATNNTDVSTSQTFACYRQNSLGTAWGSSTSEMYDSFTLPPWPGDTKDATTPIYVREHNPKSEDEPTDKFRKAYVNHSTMLIAYSIQVDCQATTNYILGADKGTSIFVYFSVERVSSDKSRNPDHENQLFFSALSGIDFVHLDKATSATIATIGHDDYVHSMIVPYLGLGTSNTTNPQEGVPIVDTCNHVEYYIRRHYNAADKVPELYVAYSGNKAGGIDYTDCGGYNQISGAWTWIYSDKVIITKEGS